MKYVMLVLVCMMMFVAGCGKSSVDNEVIAQVKKIYNVTPLICMNHNVVDLSLGVMRNGVGSMSTQDMYLYVEDKKNVDVLKKASDSGKLVKITYDTKRVNWCVPDREVVKVEIVD